MNVMTDSERIKRFYDAFDRSINAMKPCFRCSNNPTFMISGISEFINGMKITKTSRDESGACVICKHITSKEEEAILAYRQKLINIQWREILNRTADK